LEADADYIDQRLEVCENELLHLFLRLFCECAPKTLS